MQTKENPTLVAETKSRQATFRRPPYVAMLLGVACVTFGCIALARVCQIILTVGGNNISNDYLDVAPFINRVFSGQISAANLLGNLKVGQHFVALPVAFHLLSAYLFDWSARAELLVGVGINLLKAILIWDLVGGTQKKEWRPAIFGIVLALVFSMTQASVHFFGQACYPVSLNTVGFTVALWGLWRFRHGWSATVLMLAGGIGAAASMGNVPPCWLALLVGLVFYGYRRKQWPVYLAWAAGGAVSMAPYLYFSSKNPAVMRHCTHFVDWTFAINLIGRPFSNQVGLEVGRLAMSEFVGFAGLCIFAVALAANFYLRNFSFAVKTALVFCVYGLSSVLMLSCVRSFVCPWYGSFVIYFWIGTIGLLISAITNNATNGQAAQSSKPALGWKVACLVSLLIVPIIYMMSNRSWKDKHVYLSSRAPASESGLRNFRNGPTYVESLLFQWGDGKPKNVLTLAKPLERYQLSAFAPTQAWTLQGDFVLPNVRVFNAKGQPPVRFIEDVTADHTVPWSHYEHANLYLPAGNTVSWTLDLPADVQSARFKTAFAVGLPSKGAKPAIVDGVTGKIFAVTGDPYSPTSREQLGTAHAVKPGQWLPIVADLKQYKGKTVSLVFTADGGKDANDDCAVFQYPQVDVKLRRRTAEENRALSSKLDDEQWRPVNTDLHEDFGKHFGRRVQLPSLSERDWKSSILKLPVPGDVNGRAKSQSMFVAMTYTPQEAICLSDFSHLVVSMRGPDRSYWRALRCDIVTQQGIRKGFSIPLPLTKSVDEVHTCSYELKLCELPPNSRLKQMILYPAAAPGAANHYSNDVKSVQLVKETPPPLFGN